MKVADDAGLARARKLEWWTIVHIIVSVAVLYAALGTSEAMKSAFLDDFLGLVPAAAFLVAVRYVNRPPSPRYPYGFNRARSIAFFLAGVSIVLVALFILGDATMKLFKAEHPPIRSTEVVHATIWTGWLMLAALAFAAIPRAVLGRMKLPVGQELNDKVLYAEAAMNRADWLAAAAAGAGVLGIGMGWWWADSVAAIVVGADIFYEGFDQMRRVAGHLLGEVPRTVDYEEELDVQRRVEDRLRTVSWIDDVRARMREEGSAYFAEIFVVPKSGEVRVDDLAEVEKLAYDVDEQLTDVVVMPIPTLQGDPHLKGVH
jgi:cation diffusion facilitator family transporter